MKATFCPKDRHSNSLVGTSTRWEGWWQHVRWVLQLLALSIAAANSSLASAPLPLKGGASGTVTVLPQGENVFNIRFSGAGTFSTIGAFEFVLDCFAGLDGTGKPVPRPGSIGTLTTPFGDKISFTVHWTATKAGDEIHSTGTADALSGTGRFAQVHATGDFVTLADLSTGKMSLTLNGTIDPIPRVRSAAGPDASAIQATVEQFRADLGTRREINWDGVPDHLAAPYFLPGDFFNSRGAVLNTPGTGVQVSAKSSNPSGTPVRFGHINPSYSSIFKTFSAERLFSPIGSSTVDLTFVQPGTDTPALVRGFGAVYADADLQDATSFEYFDILGNSLGKYAIPSSNNGLSFLGVSFESPVVRRVRIAYGNSPLGPNDADGTDVAVMDDFIYGEPEPISAPLVTIRASQLEVCWNSKSNLTYQVQYRSELTSNAWVPLLDCVRSTAPKTCIVDSIPVGQPLRFYRVIETNCVPGL